MEISLIAAKILGTYFIISGLFLLLRGKTVPHLLKDFFDHPAIMYLTGAILIFLSSLMLLQGNIWDSSWRTVITIFTWLVFVKGAAYILAPELLRSLVSRKLLKAVNLFGLITLVVGVSLLSFGA